MLKFAKKVSLTKMLILQELATNQNVIMTILIHAMTGPRFALTMSVLPNLVVSLANVRLGFAMKKKNNAYYAQTPMMGSQQPAEMASGAIQNTKADVQTWNAQLIPIAPSPKFATQK